MITVTPITLLIDKHVSAPGAAAAGALVAAMEAHLRREVAYYTMYYTR